MITVNTATTINEDEFNRVYLDSIAVMNNGSYPWECYVDVNTDEEKKSHIRNLYDFSASSNLVIEVRDEGFLTGLFLGQWHGEELIISIVLVASDASGSKVWAYEEGYADARNAYWDSIGINGWTHRSSARTSATHRYLWRCHELNTLKASCETRAVAAPLIPNELRDIIVMPEDFEMVDDILTKITGE